MFTRTLGRSGLEVSGLGLGCWAIGGPWTLSGRPAGWGKVDDQESIRAIQFALDSGINFFDTAANYGAGHSELILSQALGRRRARAIIATKFGYIVDEEERNVIPSQDVAGNLRNDCEDSLRRLNTDFIDLYQLHVGAYPPERAGEVIDGLEGLVAAGKIRWYGWSTDNPAGARVFAQGRHCTAIQHVLNLAHDTPEMLALCAEANLASVNRTPLGMGLLTGKFSPETTFPVDDIRSTWDMQDGIPGESARQVEASREILTAGGRTLAQAALAWIWARSEITIPIPGFKTVTQMQENIAAIDFGPLSTEQMAAIDSLVDRSRQSYRLYR
jgi:aryl-alcohol dehydrogenase-like predicted oxidoreductase